jgi:predicted Zn finger-like uncharacterized protein
LIITCPGCRTRYRVDAAALTRPGGRTLRCAACGHSWRHPAAALEPGLRESEKTAPLPLEPPLAPPSPPGRAIPPVAPPFEPTRAAPAPPELPHLTPTNPAPAIDRPWASLLAAEDTDEGDPHGVKPVGAPPRRRRWLMLVLPPVLVVLIAVVAALILSR